MRAKRLIRHPVIMPSGTICINAQIAVKIGTMRVPAVAAIVVPMTGPMIQPAVTAIRTVANTPSPASLRLAATSSWMAAKSWDIATPAKARMVELSRKGTHNAGAKANANQPMKPAMAHIRKNVSRWPVRSERAPTT
ncbi:MAG: hypothetical protein M9950_12285 [Thermomicrobiales bacterium]|nr:hypothetical protein [Thermomicrobiales bacterium]